MTLRIKNLEIPATAEMDDKSLRSFVAKKLSIPSEEIVSLSIFKRSIDARKKSRIVYRYQVDVSVQYETTTLNSNASILEKIDEKEDFDPFLNAKLQVRNKSKSSPVIVGSGPCGITCALILSEAGYSPIIIERGEKVEDRISTVSQLRLKGIFSPESNYCFGEGGAGTFSDGKLQCSKMNPMVRYLFKRWVEFGAPEEVLYESKPHIGSNKLIKMVRNMRDHIEGCGGRFHFKTKLVSLKILSEQKGVKVQFSGKEEVQTQHLICAIGHSARDTYEMLLKEGVRIEPKSFAIGTRMEHPQKLINTIQYGKAYFHSSADYKLTAQVGGRGVWTFCMCPGGYLLPTGTEHGHLAINGMSNFSRNSGYANSAVVVNIDPKDYYNNSPLDGISFQKKIEKKAFVEGGNNYFAPAQRIHDFTEGRDSKGDLQTTYKPGVHAARIDKILPEFITMGIQSALHEFDKKMKGFLSREALVVGVETRTSSPIKILRGDNFQSPTHPGLYPAGEGAGYSGGIVSSAVDGLKVAKFILEE